MAGAPTDTIVVVGADRHTELWIGHMLRASWREPHRLVAVAQPAAAAQELRDDPTAWVVLDLASFHADRIGAVTELRTLAPDAAIIVLGEREDEVEALAAIRAGAQEYLIKPGLYPAMLRRALKHARERAHAESRLTHQALHDPLTGLPNRALFIDRLGVALDRVRRSGAAVAVLFLDVDNFKQINDSLGHAAGDRVLIGLADRLRTMLRPMDSVCRYGGDEFTLLFEDLANEREVVLIAERISQAAALPIALEDGQTTVTVSIGVAVVADPSVASDTVIREADAAMYRAKRSGPSRFELFDEGSRRRAMRRLDLEHGLQRAVEESELSVLYQPQFSLAELPHVIGLEALVRWRHPSRGMMAPADFIGLADETGLIVPIGHHVLKEALRQISRWRRYAPDVTVSVNLSARQLEDADLLSVLADALHTSSVEPRALCLDVPERVVAERPEAALPVMQAVKAMGVRLAIDDFGTGAAPLADLPELPVDALKIDRRLIAGLGTGSPATPVVGAIVELGHALELTVVAEGVESEAQASDVRALGCDAAQGFWFGRPVADDEVPGLLAATHASSRSCS